MDLAGMLLDDLLAYNPASAAWTNLSIPVGGSEPPTPRSQHGFAADGGLLYVFAGISDTGVPCAGPGPDPYSRLLRCQCTL